MNIQGFAPAMPAAVQQPSTMQASGSSGSSSTTSTSSTSSSDLQQTFLNLLITELQNQDPTSPVDPTAMVGQMVSLNQLDQLIAINQTLQNMSPSGSGSSTGQSSATTAETNVSTPGGVSEAHTSQAQSLAATTAAAVKAAASALPALGINTGATGTSGLMNLYGSLGLPTVNPYPTYTGAK